MIEKAISLRQPWAELVASGQKTLIGRTWRTHYRGPLIVVASTIQGVPYHFNESTTLDWSRIKASLRVTVCRVNLVDVIRPEPEARHRGLMHPLREEDKWLWRLEGAERVPCVTRRVGPRMYRVVSPEGDDG